MGRFVSATGQFLLATNGQFPRPPTGSHRCPLTQENPERWECDCPDTPWVAVWRILTPEQLRQKFAHLRNPRIKVGGLRDDVEAHIGEIQAEQEALNVARHPVRGGRLAIAPRYADGRRR